MRRLIATVSGLAVLLSASAALAGVTVRYYNTDSKDYAWPAVCHGSHYTVKFGHSRTASTTIQGSSPCVVTTPHGKVTLKGGEHIEIKNATITIK